MALGHSLTTRTQCPPSQTQGHPSKRLSMDENIHTRATCIHPHQLNPLPISSNRHRNPTKHARRTGGNESGNQTQALWRTNSKHGHGNGTKLEYRPALRGSQTKSHRHHYRHRHRPGVRGMNAAKPRHRKRSFEPQPTTEMCHLDLDSRAINCFHWHPSLVARSLLT